MTGAEVAIVAIGIDGIDVAIWALSSFAISMGLTSLFEGAGIKCSPLTEGKKDDIPKMIEEIQENYPKIKEYMRNNHSPFLDYTIYSSIGLYHDENLGDIHFFPGHTNFKDIFASAGFEVTQKEFIPDNETFPITSLEKTKSPNAVEVSVITASSAVQWAAIHSQAKTGEEGVPRELKNEHGNIDIKKFKKKAVE